MESINVSKDWLAKSKQYGTQRDAANGNNDTPAYAHNGRLPYTSLTASRLAVVGEVAAHFYLGVDPEATVFYVDRSVANYWALKANADLKVNGRKVEIRNSARMDSPLPIKEKDKNVNAIVIQVHVEIDNGRPTGKVYFIGWREGKDYRPDRAKRGTDYRHVKNDMADLKAVLGL